MSTLSIIIPVYNVEQYLDECVESLFKQGLDEKDFEVILVDDGSTDNSHEIANVLAAKHSNISVYNQKNQGQAVARNLGLDKATGKYIMFVDSDDYLVNGTINNLLNIAENKNTDLCVFSIIRQLPDLKLEPLSARYKIINEVLTGEQVLLGGYNAASACAIIYKRDFLEANNFRFRSGFAHEDVDFSSRVTAFAKRIIFTDIHSYVYRWNADSTDRSKDIEKVKRGIISDLYIAHYLMEDSNNNIYSRELKNYYLRRCNSIVVSLFLSLSKNKSIDKSFIKKCVETGKELGVYPVRGKTSSWKTTLLIPIINIESLII
jgi:glycosyltransferase involved in cell wall biosynthesis